MDIVEVTKELMKLPQVDLDEQNLFADGMYCRHGMIPAGSLIVGHIHKKRAINVLASGRMLIKTRMEDEWEEVSAPFVNSTPAGMRKIGYVLEDAYFMNIVRTDNTDMDKLYDECVYPEEGSKPYLMAEEVRKLKGGV